jgi:hypothetical protein
MYIVTVFIFQRNGHMKSGGELGMGASVVVVPDADRKGDTKGMESPLEDVHR